jgi:hypothetical protein
MKTSTIVNEANMREWFYKIEEPHSYNGDISVEWIFNSILHKDLEVGSREYQREKVASVRWKQDIMRTVLSKTHAKIPQIHFRVNTPGDYPHSFEIIDGQQRTTAIIGFLNNEYPLPVDFLTNNNINIGGMNASDLKMSYKSIYREILDYRISCIWYENLDDDQVSDLFVNVLNNVNSMTQQEIRNAIRGQLSSYIRDRARFENQHPLFTRSRVIKLDKSKNSTKELVTLSYLPKLTLKGRMEVDEWLTHLIYLNEHGAEYGISGQAAVTKWIKSIQLPGGEAALNSNKFSPLRKRCDELLNLSFKLISSVDTVHKDSLTPFVAMMLILYGDHLQSKGKTIKDYTSFTSWFFSVYDKWSDESKKIYANHVTANGGHMPPMNQLFNGKNSNAIKTIFMILNKEFSEVTHSNIGVLELDPRTSFSKSDIRQKWIEQGQKCYYTGQLLAENDIVGDHYIPRSHGVAAGGVTEYSNLVVTSAARNLEKLNMHGDEYKRLLAERMGNS